MKRKNNFLIKLFIIFISFTLIDGGRTFVIAGSNISIIINHKHNRDLEVPDYASFNLSSDNEKWIDSDNHKTIYASVSPVNFTYIQIFKAREFSKSIWQPPKST